MPAIISDQFRILNAANFVAGVADTSQSYYTFIGLPNSQDVGTGYGTTDWNTNTPAPKDGFREYNDDYDTMIALKKLATGDVKRMVRKYTWSAGTVYEMYKNNYTRTNLSPQTSSTNLYDAKYYVVNSQFKVYICINNGQNPENPLGGQSLDEPTFTDLEPRSAGSSGDGYIWKYLYTINPSDIVKFDSVDFVPVPTSWGTGDTSDVKNNAISGKIETALIVNAGGGYQPINQTFNNIPILGDGTGGKASVTVDAQGKVSAVSVTNGGTGYTRGTIQFYPGAPGAETGGPISGLSAVGVGTTSVAQFEVITPPPGGHGFDVYRELGAFRVLLYSRYENDSNNPDFITGNDFAQVGVVKNPLTPSGSVLSQSRASALTAVKLRSLTGGAISDTTYTVDTPVYQTIGVGSTAVGYVANWDSSTGVLKLYNPVGLGSTTYGFRMVDFSSQIGAGGTYIISGQTSGSALGIETSFGTAASPGTATTVGSSLVQLGQSFVQGIAPPEIQKYSGEILYIDNRAAIQRSASQKEDIKIVLEF
jgi:hypothetical protein